MPYPANSPFKDNELRHLAASACFAEAAIALGGEWNPTRLEEEVFGRFDTEQTGIFRRMGRGYIANDTTAQRLKSHTYGKCDIAKWRDLPYWILLSKKPVSSEQIQKALTAVSSPVWRLIWDNTPPPYLTDFQYSRREVTEESIKAIAACKNMDALFALIALAREARDRGMNDQYVQASYQSEEIFPNAIGETPHLYLTWKLLAARLRKIMWDPTGIRAPSPNAELDIDGLDAQITHAVWCAKQDGTIFPPREIVDLHNRKFTQ